MACFSALCKLLFLMLGSSARKSDSRTRLIFLPGSSARKMGSQTRLVFFFGSNVAFSFFQTRPWLVFRCYVNFFLSLSGPAREKWPPRPGLSHFSGLTWRFPSLRPNHGLFFGVMQTSFSHARVQRMENGLSDPTFLIFRVQRTKNGLPDPAFLPSQVQRTKIRLPAPTFLPPRIQRTKISHTARPKLVFCYYVNPFSRATHYNVPNEYPCVCAASIRSPSTAAFVADSACSR